MYVVPAWIVFIQVHTDSDSAYLILEMLVECNHVWVQLMIIIVIIILLAWGARKGIVQHMQAKQLSIIFTWAPLY